MSYRIKLPGNFHDSIYEPNYYCRDKKGELALCGINAPDRIKKRYDFSFDDALALEYGDWTSCQGRKSND